MSEDKGEDTFAKGMGESYRFIKKNFCITETVFPRSKEVDDRINSALDRVIEHWDKESKK